MTISFTYLLLIEGSIVESPCRLALYEARLLQLTRPAKKQPYIILSKF